MLSKVCLKSWRRRKNSKVFLGGTGDLSIEVPFKTGFTVIAHHKNNNVLIPPYNQLTSISWRNLLFIFFIPVCNDKVA